MSRQDEILAGGLMAATLLHPQYTLKSQHLTCRSPKRYGIRAREKNTMAASWPLLFVHENQVAPNICLAALRAERARARGTHAQPTLLHFDTALPAPHRPSALVAIASGVAP
jgi:hypothetical protein